MEIGQYSGGQHGGYILGISPFSLLSVFVFIAIARRFFVNPLSRVLHFLSSLVGRWELLALRGGLPGPLVNPGRQLDPTNEDPLHLYKLPSTPMLWQGVNAGVEASFILSHHDMTRELVRTFSFSVRSNLSF